MGTEGVVMDLSPLATWILVIAWIALAVIVAELVARFLRRCGSRWSDEDA